METIYHAIVTCNVPRDLHPWAVSAVESYLTNGEAFALIARKLNLLTYYLMQVDSTLEPLAKCLVYVTSTGI